MQQLLVFLLTMQTAALYLTVPNEKVVQSPATATSLSPGGSWSSSVSHGITTSPPPSMAFSSLITIAPLSPNPLELRQKCFDDRGFSVNCATWTGYYYTWGGAGHPYAGGPGDGSGTGSNSGTGSLNGAASMTLSCSNSMEGLKWSVFAALMTICLVAAL